MQEIRVVVIAADGSSGHVVAQALAEERGIAVDGVVRTDPSVLVLVQPAGDDPVARERIDLLTTRELEVLQELVDGHAPQLAAERLQVAVNTVRAHIKHIFAKLCVTSSLEAVSIAVRGGMRPDGVPDGTPRPPSRPRELDEG